jgi:hypothetical protein
MKELWAMCQEIYIKEPKMKAKICRSWIRRIVAGALGLVCLLGIWTRAGHAETETADLAPGAASAQVDAALQKLHSRLGSMPADDWTAFALARGGQILPPAYLSHFEKNLENGHLRRATDYARAALVADAAGMDARKAGSRQIDLPGMLAKNPSVAEEGVHAAAFALMALDAVNYHSSSGDVWNRDSLIRLLLERRAPDGGWAHSPGYSDVEVTGIVLSALAPYTDRSDVRAAADSALAWLSSVQLENGGFGHPETSEAAAQVLIALASLGIDPDRDPRFVKEGKSVLDRFLEFQLTDGTFMHRQGGRPDSLATVHALLALTAADRFQDGLSGLYRGTGNSEPVKVSFYSPGGVLAQGYGYGRTAMDAVVQVLSRNKLPYRVVRDPEQGAVLVSIGDDSDLEADIRDVWKFVLIRDQKREWNVAELSGRELKGIREIVAYYGKPPALIRSVKWSPGTPREGLPVTVTAEMETFDPAGGNSKAAPASGVTVAIGNARGITDAQGTAVLEGLKAGAATLRINGDGFAAFEQKLNVDTYAKEVQVRVEGDQGLIAQGEAIGGTALEALKNFLEARKISYELIQGADGPEIAAIAGIAPDRYGSGGDWRLAVFQQGKLLNPAGRPDTYLLNDGMDLVFYYGSEDTKIPSSVTVSPARPKAGESVTVTVTYQEWDENMGRYRPAKVMSGARVTAAGTTAVTGPSGKAVLTGLPAGVHEIEVTGYWADQAPSVLRTVCVVAVADAAPDEESIAPWAKDWVHDARAYGILPGEGGSASGAFRPKDAVTRAEFVVSLVRGLGIQPAAGPAPFEDVQSDAWYAREIAAAAEAGLVTGTAPGRFSPDAALTREQAAMLLVRALKLQASKAVMPADGDLISAAARQAVMAVMEQGWMTAQADGRFHPKQTVTREQAAVIAMRVLNREGIGRDR